MGPNGPLGGVEQVDDRIRKAREIADRGCEVFAMHRASFIERYMKADAHLAVRHRGVGRYQYGFLIKAFPATIREGGTAKSGSTHTAAKSEGIKEAAVFPGSIEVVEGEKQIIPSWVWPEVFDDVLVDLGKPLYLFEGSGIGISSELLKALPEGEVGGFGIREAVALGQGQQIEAASDTVNDGPCFRIDNGVNRLDISKAVELFTGLRIGINAHGIGFISFPRDNTLLQDWDLGYGPIDSSFSV